MPTLMAVKVLLLIAAGAAFYGWQMRDLANEAKRRAEREAKVDNEKT